MIFDSFRTKIVRFRRLVPLLQLAELPASSKAAFDRTTTDRPTVAGDLRLDRCRSTGRLRRPDRSSSRRVKSSEGKAEAESCWGRPLLTGFRRTSMVRKWTMGFEKHPNNLIRMAFNGVLQYNFLHQRLFQLKILSITMIVKRHQNEKST